VRPTRVTAAQLVEPVLNLYRGRLLNSSIQQEVCFRSKMKMLCLENEVRQVVSNLIANAIDAMRMGGRLVLRSHDATDVDGRKGVRITVADTGHGMAADTVAHIFEPFFTTKDLNGTGLGLWVSTDIVERNRGQLRVRSTQMPQHHGTVFTLFLPCESEEGEPKA